MSSNENIWDDIDNLSLIENSLDHIRYELDRETQSFFRIAKEAHLILYRSMIESLKGSNNLSVTYPKKGKRSTSAKYKMGNQPYKEIHKVSVGGCKKAWRYSEPEICHEPKIQHSTSRLEDIVRDEFLIGFYQSLAMIQTECFMRQFYHSKVIPVSDEEMKKLEWLHEEIRNEYEHFVPKFYSAPIADLIAAAELCIRKAQQLLFESGNPLIYDDRKNVNIKKKFEGTLRKINAIKNSM